MADHNGFSAQEILRSQRSEKGEAYEGLIKGLRTMRKSYDAKHVEMRKRLDDDILSIKAVGPGSVHSNTFMSNLSTQYANDAYIGERLMPELSVSKRSDSFPTYPKRERLAYPDDSLSERSEPNELNETRGSDNYSVKDYGFKNFVPGTTIENEDAPFDEMMDLVEAINEGIAFKREKRIATLLTTGTNFASANTTAVAAADRWDSASGGNPIKDIQDGQAAMWQGRGASDILAYCGLNTFNVLSRHPMILDLLKYQRSGIAQRTEIANIFGFADLLVGAAREDTANSGQTASYGRLWSAVFGMVRVAKRPGLRTACFGYTVRLKGDPLTTQWFDAQPGKSGGYYAKVAVSEQHKVQSNDTGFLYTTVTAT